MVYLLIMDTVDATDLLALSFPLRWLEMLLASQL